MYDALCTHITTGFVFDMCAVPTIYFALYTQSHYTPNRIIDPQCNRLCRERVYRSCAVPCFLCCLFVENNGGKGDAHHIGIRLRRCQYLPRLSFGRRMLRDDVAPNRFFVMYLFCDESMTIQYLKDIGLVRSKMQCNTCGRERTTYNTHHP